MKKLFFIAAVGLGYVLGARAGRERYEQIARLTRKVKNNPTVQKRAFQAADLAKHQASSAAHTVVDKVTPDHGPDLGEVSGDQVPMPGHSAAVGEAGDLINHRP